LAVGPLNREEGLHLLTGEGSERMGARSCGKWSSQQRSPEFDDRCTVDRASADIGRLVSSPLRTVE
jgi:hypothetical protein